MATTATDWTGQTLARGRYFVHSKLGQGGMALVYLALDRKASDHPVVIKAPHSEMLKEPSFASRFVREIRALVKLKHPNIVEVYDVSEHEGIPFMVMQYLAGGTLRDMKGRAASQGVAAADCPIYWLADAANALDHIHAKGYLHRDVKPDNLLLDVQGKVYLGDFGVAKVINQIDAARPQTMLTQIGQTIGTPQYMAPELILAKSFDHRVDQYALGVTVFEWLTGRHPFVGSNPTAIFLEQANKEVPAIHLSAAGIPRELTPIVRKALAKNPNDRYGSCREFADAVLFGLLHGKTDCSATAEPLLDPSEAPSTVSGKSANSRTKVGPAMRAQSKPASTRIEPPPLPMAQPSARPIKPMVFLIGAGASLVLLGLLLCVYLLPKAEKSQQQAEAPPVAEPKDVAPPPLPKIIPPPQPPPVQDPPVQAAPKTPPVATVKTAKVKLIAGQGFGTLAIHVERNGCKDPLRLVSSFDADSLTVKNAVLELAPNASEGTFELTANPAALPKTTQVKISIQSGDKTPIATGVEVPVTIETPSIVVESSKIPITLRADKSQPLAYSFRTLGYRGPVVVTASFEEANGVEISVGEKAVTLSATKATLFGKMTLTLTPMVGDKVVGDKFRVPVTVEMPPLKFAKAPDPQVLRAGETFRIDVDLERGAFEGPVQLVCKGATSDLQFKTRRHGTQDGIEVAVAKGARQASSRIRVQMQVGEKSVGDPVDFDVKIGPPFCDGPLATVGKVQSVAISPDSREFLTGGSGSQNPILWDAATGQAKVHFVRSKSSRPEAPDFAAEFARNSNTVRTLSPSGGIVWDATNGRDKHGTDSPNLALSAAAFTRDGGHMAAISDAGTDAGLLRIWDFKSPKPQVLAKTPENARLAAFSADEQSIFVGFENGALIKYDRATGVAGSPVMLAGQARAVSPDLKSLFVTPSERTGRDATLWNLTTGRKVQTFKDFAAWDACVSFGSDGKEVVTGGTDGWIIVWEIATGKLLRRRSANEGVKSVALSPDGRSALAAYNSGRAEMIDFCRDQVVASSGDAATKASPPIVAVIPEGATIQPAPIGQKMAPPAPNNKAIHLATPSVTNPTSIRGTLEQGGTAVYTVTLNPGRIYTVVLSSSSFKPHLKVTSPKGETAERGSTFRFGGGPDEARVSVKTTVTGQHVLYATGIGAGEFVITLTTP
jgi:serine/threonine protein kinase/WD40 repeat protein